MPLPFASNATSGSATAAVPLSSGKLGTPQPTLGVTVTALFIPYDVVIVCVCVVDNAPTFAFDCVTLTAYVSASGTVRRVPAVSAGFPVAACNALTAFASLVP